MRPAERLSLWSSLHDIEVRCRPPHITKATQRPEGRPLQFTKTSDGIEVTVPKVEMHSMVIFV